MEMAVVANEIVGMASRIAKGIEVNDETLAVDVIREVGPGGHFLSHKHTLKWVGDAYMPTLFDRTSEVTWAKAGKRQIYEIAREEAKKILREHVPEPLPRDVQQKISDIVKKAEKELVKTQ
jgi:trimethylamine--corrinoid protein Co-methyltransferase